ncbi:hypothetical protein S245_061043, partial [Arachis hypogaea]
TLVKVSHRWDEVEKVRLTLNEKGMQKLPGCSWVEVDGVVHEFLVGDTSYPMSAKIYEKLESLLKELREVGYSLTIEFVFFDIEEKEKEYFLGCHSQKLAVVFSLINTGTNDIIRIVKNICVCGDCHEAIKIISKVTWNEIIVRDNNRFYCFREGIDLQNYGQEGIVLARYHYDVNFITIHSGSRFPGLNIWLRNGQKVEVKLSLRCLLIQTEKRVIRKSAESTVLTGFVDRWLSPPLGAVKLNVDGCLFGDDITPVEIAAKSGLRYPDSMASVCHRANESICLVADFCNSWASKEFLADIGTSCGIAISKPILTTLSELMLWETVLLQTATTFRDVTCIRH